MVTDNSHRVQFIRGVASAAVIACLVRGVQLDIHWSHLLEECLLVGVLSFAAYATSATASFVGNRL